MKSEFWKQKMTRFFNLFDEDGNGLVEKADFARPVDAGAKFLGYAPESPEYQEMLGWNMGLLSYMQQRHNKGEDEGVTLAEFLETMEAVVADKENFETFVMGHAHFTIQAWDRDGDGMLDQKEFVAFKTTYLATEEAAVEAFCHLDLDSDGQLTQDEYVSAVREFYSSDDPNAIGNWLILDSDSIQTKTT